MNALLEEQIVEYCNKQSSAVSSSRSISLEAGSRPAAILSVRFQFSPSKSEEQNADARCTMHQTTTTTTIGTLVESSGIQPTAKSCYIALEGRLIL